jgi:hypothetical protein
MSAFASIFYEFNLPNATTWSYFAGLLAIALFFKFGRLFSLRNWDVLTVFLLVPGLLLLQEANVFLPTGEHSTALGIARLVAGVGQAVSIPYPGLTGALAFSADAAPVLAPPSGLLWFGYLWLFCGSALFLVRCLIDLSLTARPALSPNLNLAGLAWLATALFICLTTVAIHKPVGPPGTVGKPSVAVNETQRRAEDLVKQEVPVVKALDLDTRFWVERTSAIFCHLAIVAGLVFVGWRHFQDAHAGVAAATFYLLLPYTAFHVEQVHLVLPTALIIWAVAAYRQPMLSGTLLGLAAGIGYFPALLFPLWFSFYWQRGARRFAAGAMVTSCLCLAAIALILWMYGDLAPRIDATLSQPDWLPWIQPNPATTFGFWTGVRWAGAYRIPVFIVYLAFVVATLFRPAPKNLAHLIALSAAVIIGIQFWFADQGGVYVLWYLPLLLLLIFRPNLADRQAVAITSETDWLIRLRRASGRVAAWFFHMPSPLARVP